MDIIADIPIGTRQHPWCREPRAGFWRVVSFDRNFNHGLAAAMASAKAGDTVALCTWKDNMSSSFAKQDATLLRFESARSNTVIMAVLRFYFAVDDSAGPRRKQEIKFMIWNSGVETVHAPSVPVADRALELLCGALDATFDGEAAAGKFADLHVTTKSSWFSFSPFASETQWFQMLKRYLWEYKDALPWGIKVGAHQSFGAVRCRLQFLVEKHRHTGKTLSQAHVAFYRNRIMIRRVSTPEQMKLAARWALRFLVEIGEHGECKDFTPTRLKEKTARAVFGATNHRIFLIDREQSFYSKQRPVAKAKRRRKPKPRKRPSATA